MHAATKNIHRNYQYAHRTVTDTPQRMKQRSQLFRKLHNPAAVTDG